LRRLFVAHQLLVRGPDPRGDVDANRSRAFQGRRGVVPVRFSGIGSFDTPSSPPRPMSVPTGPGHTRDVTVTFDSPGDYGLTVQRTTGGAVTTAPIRVK
jgi:hypothetical protein